MSISSSISRLGAYYTRHGFVDTIRRAGLAARRALFSGRSVLFYCDLVTQAAPPADLPSFLKVERIKSVADLSPEDLQGMISVWNPKLARRNIKERFHLGAVLWMIKSRDKLAGYGWTLRGHTVEPHFFPLGRDDVHLFDFHVFPQCRGRRMNPLLVAYILSNLAAECGGRAFIEAAEWNKAQLASLGKTPFRLLGVARKSTFFGRTIVSWADNKGYKDAGDAQAFANAGLHNADPNLRLSRHGNH